jgi:hypothetical protein
MPGKVADRFGVTAIGLATLTPRDVRAWLGRVRAGGLNAGEHRATLLLAYRGWLVALLLKMVGSGWDVAWHFRFIRDDFAPPHVINLVGDGIAILLVLFHVYTRFGVDRVALRLMVAGAVLFVGSAPVDVVNHRINGLDITSWSITHFGLYTGTGMMIFGVIRGWRLHSDNLPGLAGGRSFILAALWVFFLENVLFPNQHQEYGIEEIASWDRGDVYAEPSLLAFAAGQIGRPVDRESVVHFSLPVPAWVYPLWIVGAAMLTLVLARRSVGLRWTATMVAAAYVGWRCLAWPILVAASFPTSALPFLLVAGALCIDVVFLLALHPVAQAALGAALVTTAVYAAGYAQSYLLVAPPIAYRSAPVAAGILFACWATIPRLLRL